MNAIPTRPSIRSGMSTRLLVQKINVIASRAPGVTLTRHVGRSLVWMAADGRTIIASARRYKVGKTPVTYLLRVTGYQWVVTPDMPSARIWGVGKLIPVKGFPTWQKCDQEVARILKEEQS